MKQIMIIYIMLGGLLINKSTIAQTGLQHNKKGYAINAKLNGLKDDTQVYLTLSSEHKRGLDTIAVTRSKGDHFTFKGNLSPEAEGRAFFIFLDTTNIAYKQLKRQYFLLHLENSNIQIDGSVEKMGPYDVRVEGSGVHKDLMEFNRQDKVMVDLLNDLPIKRNRLILAKDSSAQVLAKIEAVNKEIACVELKRPEFRINWIKAHLNSLITPWLLSGASDSLKRSVYPTLSKSVQNSYYGLKLKAQLTLDNSLEIGKKAPELSLIDSEGKKLSLHTVTKKNKVTIVDFWAHWCSPCRASFSKLKKLYTKYHEKGLEVYGVSTDPDQSKWLKALKEEHLPWINVIADKEGNIPKELYGVSAIPAYFILDQDGKILKKFLGLEEDQKVELEELLIEKLGK